MFRKINIYVIILILTLINFQSSHAIGLGEQDYIKAEPVYYPAEIDNKSFFYAGLKISLHPDYHINSDKPLDKFLVPSKISVEENSNIQVDKYFYPEPEIIKLNFSDNPVSVFKGTFYIVARIKLKHGYNKKNISIVLNLHYQACDDKNCYRPSDLKRTIEIKVSENRQPKTSINPPAWLKIAGIDSKPEKPESGTAAVVAREPVNSIFWFLILAFVGGIILNVMPCVLPVLSIKVLSLIKQSGENRKSFIKSNLVFISGIFTTFILISVLVILLKHAGNIVGWGFQFQSPGFIIFILTVVFCFGLSLFGVFTIILPLPDKITGSVSKLQGDLGSFFEGVLVTFLATPCTAPFLGTALGFAFTQSYAMILLIFVFIALGLSLPYILIIIFPGISGYLPKPGKWMETFKFIMGIPLMATVIWLLWVLDKVAGRPVMIAVLPFLVSLTLSCWLIGHFISLSTSFKKKIIIWSTAGLIIIISYFIFIRPALLKPHIKGPAEITAAGKIKKIPFSEDKLNKLKGKDRIVFIDFRADWCLTCQLNENAVLETDEIIKKFVKEKIIFMEADWTRNDPVITKTIRKFGKAGVPLYVIYPPGHNSKPIVLPEILTKKILLNAIEKAENIKN